MNSSAPDVTWFRLAIRGIGVLLIAWGLPSVVTGVVQGVWYFFQGMGFGGPGMDWWWLFYTLGPMVQVGVGVYLVVGARNLIAYCCRGALGMCPACNYDIRNVPGATCPECGVALPARTPPVVRGGE